MTIYVPVTQFKDGHAVRSIEELDSNKCRVLSDKTIICDGVCYWKNAYTDPRGVWLYWDKQDWRADEYRYNF